MTNEGIMEHQEGQNNVRADIWANIIDNLSPHAPLLSIIMF